jgi:hypothetical protein
MLSIWYDTNLTENTIYIRCCSDVFTKSFPNNDRLFWYTYSGFSGVRVDTDSKAIS